MLMFSYVFFSLEFYFLFKLVMLSIVLVRVSYWIKFNIFQLGIVSQSLSELFFCPLSPSIIRIFIKLYDPKWVVIFEFFAHKIKSLISYGSHIEVPEILIRSSSLHDPL